MKKIDYTIFLHGTPKEKEDTSQSKYDALEEKLIEWFFNGKYASSTDAYFIYETRQWSDSYYSVYTFFHKEQDFINRKDGYLAVTIIIKDGVCANLSGIINLLKEIYNEATGELGIIRDGKFNVPSFKDIHGLERLDEKATVFMQSAEINPITQDYHVSNYSPSPECFNNIDVMSELFEATLKRDGKVYVSDSYVSLAEKINAKKRQADKSLQERMSDVSDAVGTPVPPSNPEDILKLQQRINNLEFINANLRTTIEENEQRQQQGNNGFRAFGINWNSVLLGTNILNLILICLCLWGVFGNKPSKERQQQGEDIENAPKAEPSKDSVNKAAVKDSIRV